MSTHLRLVMKMIVVGRVGSKIDIAHDLYLLALDNARERGVCPEPANDNWRWWK